MSKIWQALLKKRFECQWQRSFSKRRFQGVLSVPECWTLKVGNPKTETTTIRRLKGSVQTIGLGFRVRGTLQSRFLTPLSHVVTPAAPASTYSLQVEGGSVLSHLNSLLVQGFGFCYYNEHYIAKAFWKIRSTLGVSRYSTTLLVRV